MCCTYVFSSSDHDSLVVLLDQHAVHERIRLEKLTEGWYFDYDDNVMDVMIME